MEELLFKINNVDSKRAAKVLMNRFKESNKKEIIIFNVGTNKIIGDSYGPLLGSMLKDTNCKIKTYGTLNNPIHALNLNKISKKVLKKHKDAFVIAIDVSATRYEEDLKKISISQRSINPGAALGKDLNSIGDISIVYYALKADNNEIDLMNCMRGIRLKEIYNAARETYKIIEELQKLYLNN